MINQQESVTFNEPIPSTREGYEKYLKKDRSSVTCTTFYTNDGGWGCTDQCVISSDYQEACVPRVYRNHNDPDSSLCWCECVLVKNLPDLMNKGEAMRAQWPDVPDFKFVPKQS